MSVRRVASRLEALEPRVLLSDALEVSTELTPLGPQLRVVGSYPLADTDRALAALADSLPVRVERRLPWWVQIVPA